jgi:CBS domain-containing protein
VETVKVRVGDVMQHEVVTVAPETPLKEVAEVFREHGIAGVPVVVEGVPVGVVSETDIVRKESAVDAEHAHDRHPEAGVVRRAHGRSARDVMSTELVVVEPWHSIWSAAYEMVQAKVNRLLVVHEGRLVGIVTRSDLVGAFVREDGDVEAEIREDVLPSLGLGPHELALTVRAGVVRIEPEEHQEEVAALACDAFVRVPGVVDVELRRHAVLA